MNGGRDHRSEGGREQDPVLAGDAEGGTDEGLRCRRAETEDDTRLDALELVRKDTGTR